MHAPATPEGALAADLALTPGLIRRAGLDGSPHGLDYASALMLAPHDCDAHAFGTLLRFAEAGLLSGLAKLKA